MTGPLRVELRRGTAPATALVMFGAGVWMLAAHPEDWGGRWSGLASYLRVSMLVLCALMVAAGAWQAGRERRRRMAEMLDSTPRPAWQPLVVAWLAVSLAGTAGLLLAFAGAAVLVGRVATYAGGGWWWTIVVGLLGLWAATAFGVLIGRTVPLRVAAPIAGLFTYVGLAIPGYLEGSGWNWLSPLHDNLLAGLRLPEGLHLLQAGWFVALTGTLLALAARMRMAALVCGVLAVAVAVPLGTGPGRHRLPAEPGAAEPVCTTTGPEVCVARMNAFLLDEVAPIAQPVLLRLTGIPGAPTRAADEFTQRADAAPGRVVDPADSPRWLRDGTLWLSLDGQPTAFGTGLARPDWLRSQFSQLVYPRCDYQRGDPDQRIYRTTSVADDWLFGSEAPPEGAVPLPDDIQARSLARLHALPVDRQRVWFGAYLAAASRCDVPRLIGLGEELW
ncbi:ABC transporter permease [Plantactinospora sp. B5E13]|uniref:ABC transporter permease n=1 Tax=Plantactinospora sp. B5E13 TaxID=3153758 RepID=UPI00325F3002